MDRFRGGNGMMGVPLLYRLRGDLIIPDLAGALDELVKRHAALRTTFSSQKRELKQLIHQPGYASIELTHFDTTTAPDPIKATNEQVRDYLRTHLDISVAPVRAALWQMAPDDHLLVLDVHHIVTDAWSNMLISRDLAALYQARRERRQADLPAIEWQYSDYSELRRELSDGVLADRDRDYLLGILRGARFPSLPPVPARPGQRRPLAGNAWFELSPEQIGALSEIARNERTTLLVILMSLFFATLHGVTGQSDIAVGAIFANRSRPEVRETVGFFANMVVVRVQTGSGASSRELIKATHSSVACALAHEGLSHLSLPHDAWQQGTAGSPEDVVFHMLAEPPTARAQGRNDFGDLYVQPQHIPDGLGCRFELEMLVIPRPTGMEGVIRYAADRFTPHYAQDLVQRYLASVSVLTGGHQPGPVPAGPGAGTQPDSMTRSAAKAR
jgi:hypothetical protein